VILGIGTDLASIRRMDEALSRHGERFAWRILAEVEREGFRRASQPGRFLAKRFAAKEAFGKALGTGVTAPATLHGIRIEHDAAGKPRYAYGHALSQLMAERGLRAHLSISDESDYALAFAIIEQA